MNGNDQAFPAEWFEQHKDNGQSHMKFAKGMTKREYFAVKLFSAIMGNPTTLANLERGDLDVALFALGQADSLIEKLSKTEPKQ